MSGMTVGRAIMALRMMYPQETRSEHPRSDVQASEILPG